MFERIFKQLCEQVRLRHYVMTIHAEEEMSNDGLSIFDVEHAILNGKIVERQRDVDTGEWKYLIAGRSFEAAEVVIVTKLSPSDKLVIITMYVEEQDK